jgi:hypothetical protein
LDFSWNDLERVWYCGSFCGCGLKKNSLIKSTFCEVDFKKSWCLVKIVVEVVVLKKAVSCVWLKNCG